MSIESPPRATARTWCGLLVLLLPALLVSMDISVLFVAAPAITEALQPTSTQWLWAMDIYGFVMAALLITMGALGDRIGRRRLLLIGSVLFGAASAALAFASGPEQLIIARAVLGIGAATLAPSTLSLVREMFADEDQRRTAVGAWTIAFSGGSVVGPIIGGVLLEYFWWGSVFLINIPVMLILLVAVPFLIPESRRPERSSFDIPGAALSLAAVLGVIYAMKHAAEHGIGTVAVGVLLLGLAAAVAFAVRQQRAPHPLIDIGLFRVPAFSASIGAQVVVMMALSGLGVLAFTFMQTVHGLSPLESALWALPTFAGTILGATTASLLAPRLPGIPLLAAGLLVAAAGFALVASVGPGTELWMFIAGYVVLTFGAGISATMAGSLVLTAAPPERAGTVAGTSEAGMELGGSLGIAIFGTVTSAAYQSGIAATAPPGTEPGALETVAGAVAAARRAADPAALLDAAFGAYTDGVTNAALLGAALIAAAATAIAVWGRRPARRDP
ncbi:DHA2 family multidrug resistance protein-like MFS transporter [Murinocardiopsis flavida]|uniref:DHA2 family multidrug resistance protein-like MFS transporter n=1 Tax=Murinocardiopsis flavida TaxID=645275 RepID=A0A2P8CGT4_9ACTN|nr:MFS transporter [Murinocardiopsis flavida]PSK84194.1 DHA2 family multidrug resistance protein-like MFS transporter [Murinocardiopsis flavida]